MLLIWDRTKGNMNVKAISAINSMPLYLTTRNPAIKSLKDFTAKDKIALPAVFPHYLTGAITASGGTWNASIVAEVANWGDTKLRAHGLGAYIADATQAGDFRLVVLGIAVMAFFVVVVNRLVWRPLYWYAERKYRLT